MGGKKKGGQSPGCVRERPQSDAQHPRDPERDSGGWQEVRETKEEIRVKAAGKPPGIKGTGGRHGEPQHGKGLLVQVHVEQRSVQMLGKREATDESDAGRTNSQ